MIKYFLNTKQYYTNLWYLPYAENLDEDPVYLQLQEWKEIKYSCFLVVDGAC